MIIGNIKLFEYRRIPTEKNTPVLLHRWIIFRCKWFGIFLHKFCRSDYKQSLHCHPWTFISIILKGGYNEVTETTAPGIGEKYELITPGRILYRPAEWRHRVELINEQPSWSIILVGQRKRKWGFWPNGKWCFWRKFDYSNNICEEDILWDGGDDD